MAKRSGIVYFLQRTSGDIKIGTTVQFKQRLADLEDKYGALNLLGMISGSFEKERELHLKFSKYRIGRTEFFIPNDELIRFIQEHAVAEIETQPLKSLPATVLPVDGYDLIREYAFDSRMSISEAVRSLLAESPRLIEYANQKGREINLSVEERGGSRSKKED